MRKELLRQLPLYALVALLLSLVFLSFSPLWNGFCSDQSMFSIIGDNWSRGKLPYVGTWDSKGPIIFFVNMVGHSIAQGEMGIFILQTVNLVLVLLLSHYYIRKYCTLRQTWAYNAVFLMAYVIICSGGNQVGDTNLLLAVWSVFLCYEWSRHLHEGNFSHPWSYAFVYGMFVSSCLLSRLTNAMLVVFLIAAIAIILIWKGLWRNLFANILSFSVGFAVVFLPFAIYFASHNAWDDMWYAMFTYNMEYALHSSDIEIPRTLTYPLYFVAYFICLITTVIYAAIAVTQRDRRLRAIVWGSCSLLTLLWLLKSYSNANYAISYLPVIFVALIELGEIKQEKKIARTVVYLVIAYVAVFFLNHIRVYRSYMAMLPEVEAAIDMTRNVPKSDSFVVYNVDPTYYIFTDRMPCYRFFTIQDWAIANGPSLRPLVRDCFAKGNARWILAEDASHCAIRDVLEHRYQLVAQNKENGLTLYRLKE